MKHTRLKTGEFFKRLAPGQQVLALFDLLPDVSFFVKDRKRARVLRGRRAAGSSKFRRLAIEIF